MSVIVEWRDHIEKTVINVEKSVIMADLTGIVVENSVNCKTVVEFAQIDCVGHCLGSEGHYCCWTDCLGANGT